MLPFFVYQWHSSLLLSRISLLNLFVHFVDLGLEDILGHIPLKLEGACEDAALWGEELGPKDELLWLLERAEFVLHGVLLYLSTHS